MDILLFIAKNRVYITLAGGVIGFIWVVIKCIKHGVFFLSAEKVYGKVVGYHKHDFHPNIRSHHKSNKTNTYRVPIFEFELDGEVYRASNMECTKPLFRKTRALYCRKDNPEGIKQLFSLRLLILLLFFIFVIKLSTLYL